MGTTTATMQPDDTPLSFLRREFTQNYEPGRQSGFRVLSDHITPGAYFAVIERTSAHDGQTHRACIVCLYQASTTTITFKEIQESAGPRHPAPPSFIANLAKLIPEPPNDWAYHWRTRSQAQITF